MTQDRHRAVQHRSTAAGVEAVTMSTDRSFPRHAHDHLGFGVVAFGAHRSWSGSGSVEAAAGDCIMVNPGEIHDGVAVDGGARGWHMLYLDPTLPGRLLDGEAGEAAEMVRPTARDPQLAALFAEAFAMVAGPWVDPLACEAALVAAAAASGFADQSHLTRAFLRQFGVTPGRYRAAVR